MSRRQGMSTPSERFRSLMGVLCQPEHVAMIEHGMESVVLDPREVPWHDDADPFGRGWDWLTPDPEAGRENTSSPAELH